MSLLGRGKETIGRLTRSFIAIFFAGFLLSALVSAQTSDTWIGGTGNWSNASNWNNGVPTSTSNVFIGNGASAVTLDISGAQSDSLTIYSGDSLTMPSGTSLTVNGSTISNAGSFFMDATSAPAYLSFVGNVTLTGAGGITMSNSADNYFFANNSQTGNSLTNQSTIQGAGYFTYEGNLGSGNSITNQGTINANQSTPLIIGVGSGTFTNTGTLEATNGGTLGLFSGTITNSGGTIHADPGSTVQLQQGMTIVGGTLTTTGTGAIQANCCGNTGDTINGVTLKGTFQFNDGEIGDLEGTITNNGSLQLNASSSNVQVGVLGAVTLQGTGTVTLSNNTGNYFWSYANPSTASLLNEITIEGAGSIGNGNLGSGNSITNQGTINANQSNPLVIGVGEGSFTNTGQLEATNGGTLGLFSGTITNTGGTIHADAGSTVQLEQGMTIVGGTLTTTGSGVIEANCCDNFGTLDGVTNEGTFQFNNADEGSLQGTITNDGTIQLNSTSAPTYLNMIGAVVLTGKGTLAMSNSSNNYLFANNSQSGLSLTNESTIEGGGNVSYNGALGTGNTFLNDGTIYANQKTSLNIGVSSGSFTNTGTLKVKAGSAMYITGGGFTNFSSSSTTLTGGKYLVSGTLEFDGADVVTNAASITLTGAKSQIVNQSDANGLANFAANAKKSSLSIMSGKSFSAPGNVTNAGTLTVGAKSAFQTGAYPNGTYTQTAGSTKVDGTLTAATGMTIQAGTLLGAGTIASTVQSSGSVTPGDSATKPGILSVSGTYTQNETGSLNVYIGGTTVGTQYNQLAVTNGVSLNGTLNIKLTNGFVPAVGDTFTILTGSAVSGTFATVKGLSINSSEHFTITYNSANVTLTVASGT